MIARMRRIAFVVACLGTCFSSSLAWAENVAAASEAPKSKLEATADLIRTSRNPGSGSEQAASIDPSVQGSGLKMVQGLAACLAVLLIGSWAVKRHQKGVENNSSRRLKILERLPLAPKTFLVLAEVEGKKILLSVGSERVTMLESPQSHYTEFAQAEEQLSNGIQLKEEPLCDARSSLAV